MQKNIDKGLYSNGGETNESDNLLEFTIPNYALSSLINGDDSGLEDEDIEKIDKFVNRIVEKYGNANFMLPDEDEMDLGFKYRNDIDGNLGADCSLLYLMPSKRYDEGGETDEYDDDYDDGGVVVPNDRLETNEQSEEERELELYIDNDESLYRQRKFPIEKNLIRKLASGKFDINQAPKIYKYLIDDGIKKYTKDFGGITLTKDDKENLAKNYVNQFLDDADSGQFDEYIPKKYRMADGGMMAKGGVVTMGDLERMIEEYNEEGRNFELRGAYGYLELWSNGHRLEVGSKKDIKQALIKYRFNEKYADGGIMAKGGNIPMIEKRVAEVNALIKEGNDKGVKVVDESITWQSPMKYNPLKYSNGVLYVSYEELDLYKHNKGMGSEYKSHKFKVTKNDTDYGFGVGVTQRYELSNIARMYRKAINSFNKYGYADGGMMAKGGIPNNYRGKTSENIWNELTENQRIHFMIDHAEEIGLTSNMIPKYAEKGWSDLNEKLQDAFAVHTMMGQYAEGGTTDGKTLQKVKVTIKDVDMGGDVVYKGDHWFKKDQLANKTNEQIGDFILKKYGLDYGNTYKYSIVKTKEEKQMMAKGGHIYLSVDSDEPITLEEFIKINSDDDVEGLTQQEIDMLKNLEVGDVVSVGMVDVKRVMAKGGEIKKKYKVEYKFPFKDEQHSVFIMAKDEKEAKSVALNFLNKKYKSWVLIGITLDNEKRMAKGGVVSKKNKMLNYLNMYFDYYTELRTIAVEEDNILTRKMLPSLDDEQIEMAYEDAKYEIKADTQYDDGGVINQSWRNDKIYAVPLDYEIEVDGNRLPYFYLHGESEKINGYDICNGNINTFQDCLNQGAFLCELVFVDGRKEDAICFSKFDGFRRMEGLVVLLSDKEHIEDAIDYLEFKSIPQMYSDEEDYLNSIGLLKVISDKVKSKMADGGMMAKGGEVFKLTSEENKKLENYFSLISKKEEENRYLDEDSDEYKDNENSINRLYNLLYDNYIPRLEKKYRNRNELKKSINKIAFDYGLSYKMGGVTFDEKVESISESLMERKKVSPKVQKDYGKTYNKKESVESAKRIAGAMRSKENAKKKS